MPTIATEVYQPLEVLKRRLLELEIYAYKQATFDFQRHEIFMLANKTRQAADDLYRANALRASQASQADTASKAEEAPNDKPDFSVLSTGVPLFPDRFAHSIDSVTDCLEGAPHSTTVVGYPVHHNNTIGPAIHVRGADKVLATKGIVCPQPNRVFDIEIEGVVIKNSNDGGSCITIAMTALNADYKVIDAEPAFSNAFLVDVEQGVFTRKVSFSLDANKGSKSRSNWIRGAVWLRPTLLINKNMPGEPEVAISMFKVSEMTAAYWSTAMGINGA